MVFISLCTLDREGYDAVAFLRDLLEHDGEIAEYVGNKGIFLLHQEKGTLHSFVFPVLNNPPGDQTIQLIMTETFLPHTKQSGLLLAARSLESDGVTSSLCLETHLEVKISLANTLRPALSWFTFSSLCLRRN